MKRAVIIHYTDRGGETAGRIAAALSDTYQIEQYRARCNLGELFEAVDALIFVGACGIAVRAIAPHLKSKTSDPAVIVTDERGMNVISLISGHIGGANALTRRIAAAIGGNPVITTATDVNRRFAADEWAARQGIAISSMAAARRFAMEILRRDLPMTSDFPIQGALPGGLYSGTEGDCGLLISCVDSDPYGVTLKLIPRILHLGLGCKRNTPVEKIRMAVEQTLQAGRIRREAIVSAASIDVKRDEEGLLTYCAENELPIRFYSAEELRSVAGEFSASAFVSSTVGVDNVCERAAMRSAGENGKLIVKKTCLDGVTVAIAQEEWSVHFE